MNYPLISEYVEAIKLAEDNFDELSYLRPVLDDDGLPIMTSGNFAVVFKMKEEQSGKYYAVKCFTKDQEGRTESYKLIADELEFVSSNYLTPIMLLEKELFVDTDQTSETEFPVLLMDWVDGIPMDKYIQKNINNQYALDMLAFRFSKLATWLLVQPYAHGDLKPDNILIKDDGSIVLVDYDGMYVPAMKGQKARELGSPNYRHPLRTDNDFNSHIDDFALVTIALSLKAIALKPKLFFKNTGECGLLFNDCDYRDIKTSKVLQELMCLLPDNDLVNLLGLFFVVLSQKELKSLSANLFVIEKPIQKEPNNIINKGTKCNKNDEIAYQDARNYIKNKENQAAYDIFRTMTLSPYGQNGLGFCYARGIVVDQNFDKAAYWFKASAKQGFGTAKFNLANCYYLGKGMRQDYSLADYWYSKAAEDGVKLAQEMKTYINSGYPKAIEDKRNVERWEKIASLFIL